MGHGPFPSDCCILLPAMSDRGDITRPAELMVFMAPTCPHCGQAVATAEQMARDHAKISVRVVNAQEEADLASTFVVKSVPTTILDGGISWVGVVPANELMAAIRSRDEADFTTRIFRSLIESGRVNDATRRLCDGSGLAPFLDNWRNSTTSTRMGLMLAAEEALEEIPAALDSLVQDLVKVLETDDGALRGDTADLLGQVGHPAARKGLEALLDDPIPDVAEIAADSLHTIRSD